MCRVPAGTVDCVLSYCHYTLCDDSLEDIIPYLQSKGVGIINASPLCMGLLTRRGPPAWHPAPAKLVEAAAAAAKKADDYGVDIAELALQFSIKNENISTTLVGICTREQVEQNCRAVLGAIGAVEQGKADVIHEAQAEVQTILKPLRRITWPSGLEENN